MTDTTDYADPATSESAGSAGSAGTTRRPALSTLRLPQLQALATELGVVRSCVQQWTSNRRVTRTTAAAVADLYDTSARSPEPLLLPYRATCWRAVVDHAQLAAMDEELDALEIRL